jgi:hypothetical protein
MIHDQGLPMHLWAEASNTVVYVQNRSPQKILGNKTPKEVFTGKKPEVSHLRIFGCPRLEGKSIVTSKWIYKIKHAIDDNIEKYKARFVARGFSQKEGEDYDETFAPVSKHTSIRSIIAIAFAMGWKLH